MADRPPAAGAKGEASPGGLLRRRREKRALSVAEVAKRLHLDAGIIEALEKDDYARIASPVYARGYLASYARLVEADGERISALFDNIAPAEPPAIAPAVKPPMQVSSSHHGLRALSCLIALGLIVLFVIWYRGHFSTGTLPVDMTMDEAPPAPAMSAAAPAALPAPAPVTDMASAAPVKAGAPRPETQAGAPQPQTQAGAGAPQPQTQAEAPQPQPQTQAGTGADSMPPALTPAPFVAALAGEAADEAEPAREAGQAAMPGPGLPAPQTSQTGPPPEINEAAPPSSAAAPEDTENDEAATIIAPVPAAAPDSLRLTFSDDSWVEVYDANENRLFRDLALSGEEHLIEGVAPFRILFGFAPGVTAEFNGERVEHAAYARYGIARFTLPEAARP